MGCDIHAFVDLLITSDDRTYAQNIAKIDIQRDYWLFILLAGIRDDEIQGQKPISLPKGLPEHYSIQVRQEALLWVVDKEENEERGCCTREEAERWGNNYVDEEKNRVYHPDWHSYSWLTLSEVKEVIERYSLLKERDGIWVKNGESVPEGYQLSEYQYHPDAKVYFSIKNLKPPVELLCILAIMNTLEEQGFKSNFVFWFDN